jgi:integrase
MLLDACPRVFTRELVAATMRTTIGLLAATGMRIGEALRLRPADIDTTAGVLTIRESKNGSDRLIALHPSTAQQLIAYQQLAARTATRPQADGPLLVTTGGTGYHRVTIEAHFAKIVTTPLGCNHGGGPGPDCTTCGTRSPPRTWPRPIDPAPTRSAR